jgi:hypothetical protein
LKNLEAHPPLKSRMHEIFCSRAGRWTFSVGNKASKFRKRPNRQVDFGIVTAKRLTAELNKLAASRRTALGSHPQSKFPE